MTDANLRARVDAIEPWMIGIRRALHQIPEPGFQEFETQKLIMRALDELGIPYQAQRTWIVALIEGARPGPTVALRADMDALPIGEPDGLAFASQTPGRMHACGHDAHMAIQLGAARVLNELRDELRGSVKLLFQPAEETEGGADPMVKAGVLENPHVDAAYGLHVQPYLPVGAVETRPGTLNASTDELNIRVLGKASHGAYPEGGADAILAAAHIVTALQSVVSRNVSPLASAVVSIGRIEGGTAANVVCSEVHMRGTLRAATPELRQLLKERCAAIAEHTAQALGCSAEVRIAPGYCALVNDAACADQVLRVAARLLGNENAITKAAPSMGAEDFAYFIADTPGAFYHLGCSPAGSSKNPPLHSEQFTLDEGCLKIGALMQAALVLDAMGG